MFRPRVIPVLLLNNDHLIKSFKFKKYNYIGDPINAVKIFNDLKSDELVFLDITATKEKRLISLDFVKEVGEEANMPFAVGGGISKLTDINKIINSGAEKVIIGAKSNDYTFLSEASNEFGTSTICVCVDVSKKMFSKKSVYINNAKNKIKLSIKEHVQRIQESGVGEIIIQSVDRDGTMSGYDIDLLKEVSETVSIPVVALGGAGTLEHMKEAYKKTYCTGLAGGSFFVYKDSKKGVLISYPEKEELIFVR